MSSQYADTLEKNWLVGGGTDALVYHVTPIIVVKAIRANRKPKKEDQEHPFDKEIAFYKGMRDHKDRCQDIVQCFLILTDHLFLSYCEYRSLGSRLGPHQEREVTETAYFGRLIRIKEYEDPNLVARWIQQLSSALAHVEKLCFCHNDLHAGNCLLDSNINLKLSDFGRATTVGKFLEDMVAPRALPIRDSLLKGSYGLCSARTEQFALGTLLYLMLYGHEPYDDLELGSEEWDRFGKELEFPKSNRNEVLDGLISTCWYNVYPTMALVAYDFKRKTKHMTGDTEPGYITIDSAKETKTFFNYSGEDIYTLFS
ncbi:hypothetical protein N7540_010408 [Penicillium herquei]|nr:hypothetical protein N7540_010408 [Penicillium herquei]